MGERKLRTSSRTAKSSSSTVASTMSIHKTTSLNTAKLVRCPDGILNRLRRLNEAEVITLFTPFVPHPPATTLAKNMDPFEPLGRALPRQVRHVPYRLDSGMTELHSDFLPASGAVVVVICVTNNIINSNARAFDQQLSFARDVWRNLYDTNAIASIPAILLLVSNDANERAYVEAMRDFPALVTLNDYTTSALANAVHVLFGS